MKNLHQDFIAGARDTLPILLGVVPFGMICGVGAVSVGLTPFETIGMMFIVFAGASQLVVYQLISVCTPWLIMVLTSLIINVRFTMYSAALAPHLQKEPLSRKALLAFLITDQAFGVAMSRFMSLRRRASTIAKPMLQIEPPIRFMPSKPGTRKSI